MSILRMADTEAKTELLKEVLAPKDIIREDLVTTAVKFLQNPKVQQSALSQKKAFLQRKGLTSDEIDVAVGRANVQSAPEVRAAAPQQISQYAPENAPDVSKWVKARDIMAVITMVTGISYGAYKLYKEFLVPWLFGLHTKDQRLEILEQTVTDSMANLNTTLASIEETLSKQQEKLQILSHDVNFKTGGSSTEDVQNSASINELKTELSSIKGLLLNRRQFPPVPNTTPVLPAWQLVSKSGDADSNNKGSNESTETTNTITLSSSPAHDNPAEIIIEQTDNGSASALEAGSAATEKNSVDIVGDQADSHIQVSEDMNDSEGNESVD